MISSPQCRFDVAASPNFRRLCTTAILELYYQRIVSSVTPDSHFCLHKSCRVEPS